MTSELETLEQIIMSVLNEESNWAGVPVSLVLDETLRRADMRNLHVDKEQVIEAVESLVDRWAIDKTIAELTKGMEKRVPGYEGGPVWNLKIMDEKRKSRYEALSPTEKAAVKLLREQNQPLIGSLPEEEGRKILMERGFHVERFGFHIEGIVRSFMALIDGEWAHWFGLIWEHERITKHREA